MGDVITVRQIRDKIREHQFRHADEFELHAGIESILAGLGLTVRREVRLDKNSRIDLTTELARPGAAPVLLGVEAKIAGQPGDVRRQVQRYAEFPQFGALLLVTTVYRHMIEMVGCTTDAPAGNVAGARRRLGAVPFECALINRGML